MKRRFTGCGTTWTAAHERAAYQEERASHHHNGLGLEEDHQWEMTTRPSLRLRPNDSFRSTDAFVSPERERTRSPFGEEFATPKSASSGCSPDKIVTPSFTHWRSASPVGAVVGGAVAVLGGSRTGTVAPPPALLEDDDVHQPTAVLSTSAKTTTAPPRRPEHTTSTTTTPPHDPRVPHDPPSRTSTLRPARNPPKIPISKELDEQLTFTVHMFLLGLGHTALSPHLLKRQEYITSDMLAVEDTLGKFLGAEKTNGDLKRAAAEARRDLESKVAQAMADAERDKKELQDQMAEVRESEAMVYGVPVAVVPSWGARAFFPQRLIVVCSR